jgi:hypothetical protein
MINAHSFGYNFSEDSIHLLSKVLTNYCILTFVCILLGCDCFFLMGEEGGMLFIFTKEKKS